MRECVSERACRKLLTLSSGPAFVQITYQCVPGFELVGKDTRYCQSDGTWTPSELPTCVPVQCPIPDSPVNGKAMFTAVAYKSVVSYECKYGFMIVGNATRTCGEDKSWGGADPECKEINCGSPGFLPNGWLEGSRTTLHAVVTFKCIEGMEFEGQSFRTTCQVRYTFYWTREEYASSKRLHF